MNIANDLQIKYDHLRGYLSSLDGLAVAFSGGVDSTFLLKVAHDVLGDRCIAVTGRSASFPERELQSSKDFCQKEGIRQLIFDSNEMDLEDYVRNPKNRCYYCKHTLFTQILTIAKEKGISQAAEGSNMDDLGDYRPGLQAVAELGVLSPLRNAKLYKQEIRDLSHELGLPTWNKQAFACLSSRFVYGERITPERLRMVEQSEYLLSDLGISQYRVRIHEDLARIEISPKDFPILMKDENRTWIVTEMKKIGFQYITLDLQGYRMGSMNETLNSSDKETAYGK